MDQQYRRARVIMLQWKLINWTLRRHLRFLFGVCAYQRHTATPEHPNLTLPSSDARTSHQLPTRVDSLSSCTGFIGYRSVDGLAMKTCARAFPSVRILFFTPFPNANNNRALTRYNTRTFLNLRKITTDNFRFILISFVSKQIDDYMNNIIHAHTLLYYQTTLHYWN